MYARFPTKQDVDRLLAQAAQLRVRGSRIVIRVDSGLVCPQTRSQLIRELESIVVVDWTQVRVFRNVLKDVVIDFEEA